MNQGIDIRELAPRDRHPIIFSTFEALQPGEGFVLVNDYDLRPLFYQFKQGPFTWEYLERGPEIWRVRIGKAGWRM